MASPFVIENELKKFGFSFVREIGELVVYENPL